MSVTPRSYGVVMAVIEQVFVDQEDGAGTSSFDFRERCNELRCRPTGWLRARRDELTRERRRLYVEQLAVIRVLGERDAAGFADPTVSPRTSERDRKAAECLEQHPNLARAAHQGRVSEEQLEPATRLADEDGDEEWATRAPNLSPGDLKRMAARRHTPTREDAQARREARHLGFWWNREAGMLDGRFSLPDLDGALVENVLNHMIDRMRPAKGQPWDTRAHRAADALVELCRSSSGGEPTGTPLNTVVVEVPIDGPATVKGVPLSAEQIEALRAQARVEPVVVDKRGAPVATGRARRAISDKTRRAVLLRDAKCRWPGCERRTGLDVHHTIPVCWGGTDDVNGLVAACVGGGTDHHHRLVPHGEWWLLGNPNLPDGMRLVHRDDPDAPRAGPSP